MSTSGNYNFHFKSRLNIQSFFPTESKVQNVFLVWNVETFWLKNKHFDISKSECIHMVCQQHYVTNCRGRGFHVRFIFSFLLFEKTVQSRPGQKVKRCSKTLTMNFPLSFNLRSVLISVWIIPDFIQAKSSTSPAAQADTEIWATDYFYARSTIRSVGKHRNTVLPLYAFSWTGSFILHLLRVNTGSHFRFLYLAQLDWAERFQHQIRLELCEFLPAITFLVCKKTQHS